MAHKEPASFCVLENHWSSQDQKPSLTIFNQILTSALEQVSENNTDINQNTLKNSKRKITGKCLQKSFEENKSQTSKTSQFDETQEQNSISDGLANLSCRTVVPVNLHLQRKFHYTRFGNRPQFNDHVLPRHLQDPLTQPPQYSEANPFNPQSPRSKSRKSHSKLLYREAAAKALYYTIKSLDVGSKVKYKDIKALFNACDSNKKAKRALKGLISTFQAISKSLNLELPITDQMITLMYSD